MIRGIRRALIPALTLLIAAGCSGGPGEATEARPPLRIAAAADLRDALPELLAAFGDRDGPVAPPTFGASGDLAEQIRGGAPFDVFLSADLDFPRSLERAGLLERGSVVAYARGSLVLLVHPGVAAAVGTLADLTKPEIRAIAIAAPDVAPYGKAARAALENAGLWEPLRSRIVPVGSVSRTLLHVEEGNADAAIVSRSLAGATRSKVVAIDPALYPPRLQGAGIVANSPNGARARRFVDFLTGGEGRRILAESGFEPPESRDEAAPSVP